MSSEARASFIATAVVLFALAAQVARVESLAEEWSTELDENRCPAHAFPGCDCHEGYHHAWDDLRAALAGPTALDAMGADQ